MRNPVVGQDRSSDPLLAAAAPSTGGIGCRLERRQGASAECTHCGRTRLARWGRTRRGLQRWRCRDCRRSFCATTGTPLAHTHDLDAFARVLADMLGPSPRSCRQLAAAVGVGRMTVWRWRRRICRALQRSRLKPPQDGQADPTRVVRESRKASREWVNHVREPVRFPAPDRLRWVDYQRLHLPLPDPMEPYHVGIHVVRDAHGTHRIELDGAFAVAGSCRTPPPCPATKPGLRRKCAKGSAAANVGVRAAAPFSKPEVVVRPAAADGRLDDQLAGFLEPFRGPATRYLRGYVAWFATRLDAGAGAAGWLAWDGLLRSTGQSGSAASIGSTRSARKRSSPAKTTAPYPLPEQPFDDSAPPAKFRAKAASPENVAS